MTRHLQREVSRLKKQVRKLGKVVQENLDDAIKSVRDRDPKLAEEVIQKDQEIDQMEVDTEEECLKLLALYQPVAVDLRFIIAALKMNNDLERIGDLALNIAKQAKQIASGRKLNPPFDVDEMTTKVQSMVAESMASMVNMDATQARRVMLEDEPIDRMHREMYEKVEKLLGKRPKYADIYIRYLSVSRYLERIADHATNIAEDVIYLVEGEITRHGGGDLNEEGENGAEK
ncbi:phosphate signaling complex protein PhoU [candidate division WOR-3 bacterium]|uniref:Phosphate-specific transport system accessory protein PhoU n=1 Tax=candidate division WOR-3 bacterium TaxID=2052148 RepID=A0A9D5K8M7_UNCW3|nr:phosphate signaling complex protein PhoU [candidate division WOR-3 bacterium]MBD3364134.1 phosphate signaling complex protein PhoU [candidate division WOR-3 bacterium]